MPKKNDESKKIFRWNSDIERLLMTLANDFRLQSGGQSASVEEYKVWMDKIISKFDPTNSKQLLWTQVRSKSYRIAKDYRLWRQLSTRTGAGWDPETGTLTASDEWWADALKVS